MGKKVIVEQSDCISCGLCVSTCPAVFRFDGSGRSNAYNPSGAPEKTIQQAIDGCPVQCIYWE